MKRTTSPPSVRRFRDDAGFSLAEILVTMVVSMIVIGLVTPILETVSGSASTSEATASGTAQARLAVDNLASQVGSAIQICLPTVLTATGPTVAPGFAVRVESLAFGKTQWDQWMLDTSTQQLEEQQWPTTWVTSNPVPPWVPVAQPLINTATPPFALGNSAAGSPQDLAITFYVSAGARAKTPPVIIQSTIAALSTPYAPAQPAQPCATTED